MLQHGTSRTVAPYKLQDWDVLCRATAVLAQQDVLHGCWATCPDNRRTNTTHLVFFNMSRSKE